MKDMPGDIRHVMEVARAALRSKSKLKRSTAIKAINDALSPMDASAEPSKQKNKAPPQVDALLLVRPEQKVAPYDDLLGRRQAGDFRMDD